MNIRADNELKPLLRTLGVLIAAFAMTGCSSLMKTDVTGSKELRLPFATTSAVSDEALEMTFGMARVAERNQRPQEAIAAYEAILKDRSDHVPSLHRLGVIAARGGRVDDAMDYFIEAASHGEPSADLLGDIGYTQYLADDFQAAALTLQKAIHKDPSNNRTVNNLAIVMGMQKRYGDSLQLFRQTGDEAESLAGVAFLQAQTGELAQAKASYHRSLEVDSSLDVAANGLVELDRASKSNVGTRPIANNDLATSERNGVATQEHNGLVTQERTDRSRVTHRESEQVNAASEFTLVATTRPGTTTYAPAKRQERSASEKKVAPQQLDQRPSPLTAVKMFASSVRSSDRAKPAKLTKPPVIAMPPAVPGNTAKIVLDAPSRPTRLRSPAGLRPNLPAVDSMTASQSGAASVPVAQAPAFPHPHQRPDANTATAASLPPIVQARDASRSVPLLKATTNVRQVGYDQLIGR